MDLRAEDGWLSFSYHLLFLFGMTWNLQADKYKGMCWLSDKVILNHCSLLSFTTLKPGVGFYFGLVCAQLVSPEKEQGEKGRKDIGKLSVCHNWRILTNWGQTAWEMPLGAIVLQFLKWMENGFG